MIAVQEGITAAVCCCVCDMVIAPRHLHLWCFIPSVFRRTLKDEPRPETSRMQVLRTRYYLAFQHLKLVYEASFSSYGIDNTVIDNTVIMYWRGTVVPPYEG